MIEEEIGLSILKVLLSWPVMVALVLIVMMVMFKPKK